MRLWLDPERMAELGLTAGDMVAAVAGPERPGRLGRAHQQPVPQPGAFELNIQTLGRLEDPRQFENIIVKTDAAAGSRACATWPGSSWAPRTYLQQRLSRRAPGGGARRSSSCRARTRSQTAEQTSWRPWRSWRGTSRRASTYDVVYNPTEFVQESVDAVIETIFEAVAWS